jgi:hypothetical protein
MFTRYYSHTPVGSPNAVLGRIAPFDRLGGSMP